MTSLPKEPSPGDKVTATMMRDVIRSIRERTPIKGPGMKLSTGPNGTVFSCIGKSTRETSSLDVPFKVRHVEQDSENGIPYTGWEIYLPPGCMNVNTTCSAMNKKAYRTVDGEDVPIDGWYRMTCPSSGPTRRDEWLVRVHAKCNSALSGVNMIYYWPENYMWADIDVEKPSDMTPFAGDSLCVTVGRIRPVTVGEETVNTYFQNVKSAVSATAPTNEQMELLHVFSVDDEDGSLALERLFVMNFSFAAAGTTYLSANRLNEIDAESEEVYLNVNVETDPFTADVNGYKSTDGNSASSMADADKGPFKLQILLFELKDGCVTKDARKNLCNVQIYKR